MIAIDNVRLFNETRDALEQQTASAEVLQVISSSLAETQPVFDVILNSCERLFRGRHVGITLVGEDGLAHFGAYHGPAAETFENMYPLPINRETGSGLAILERRILHYPDVQGGADVPESIRQGGKITGLQSVVMAPLLGKDRAVGAMFVGREFAGAFSDKEIALIKTFADQAVIAIENVRLFNETKEALEQQRASGEVLSVISNSIADAQPVFEKIVESCERLFASRRVGLNLVGQDGMVYAGAYGKLPGVEKFRTENFPHPATADSATGAAILARNVIHYPDALGDSDVPLYARRGAQALGFRAFIMAPLLSEERGLGAIFVGRETAGPFSDKEIALLKTFANQAVIAIQNARLFNETKEALERQTATAEILKVISASHSDVAPVLDAVVERAARICESDDAVLFVLEADRFRQRARFRLASHVPESHQNRQVGLDRSTIMGAAVLDRQPIQIEDLQSLPDGVYEEGRRLARELNHRATLAVPLLRDDAALGALLLRRIEARPFTDKQISLLRTFADQAAIGIENVRLFNELQQRTDALTKSVDQLTALGEVSQTLSSTLDLDKVLPTIVSRAVQLTGLDGGAIYEYDEARQVFSLRGGENVTPELVELYQREPIRLGEGAVGGAAAAREPVQIADIVKQGYESRARDVLVGAGARALLAVPLLREGHILGALAVIRNSPGEFAPEVVDLLKTFATQSAIAIQNARLFREIEDKGRQLEEASQHKSQFLASMSHELRTPLNAILGFNEMILGEVYGEVPGDMKEPLEDIQTSGKHLLRLINNVLDLAKIEAGRMELALADYAVQDMVESVRATLRPLAENKGLEFLVSVPNDLPLAHGDSGRLTQCLMNLAGNSLKFTKQGRKCPIAVEQNGDDADLPRRRHRHRHSAREDRQPVHRVQADRRHHRLRVRRHGARARHHQAVHRDARRPDLGGERARQGLELHLRDPAARRGRSRRMSAKTILYVEDNEANRMIVRDLLKRTKYQLIEAHDGEAGVATALEKKPDLILMDIQLPKISGMEAMRRIRAEASMANTPIIAITSFALSGRRAEGKGSRRHRLPRQALQSVRPAQARAPVRARFLIGAKKGLEVGHQTQTHSQDAANRARGRACAARRARRAAARVRAVRCEAPARRMECASRVARALPQATARARYGLGVAAHP